MIVVPQYRFMLGDARNTRLAAKSVQLVIGSPPYLKRRTYGIEGQRRDVPDWIDFMVECTREAVRISTGPVLWVVNGCVEDGVYQPAVEGLIFRLWQEGLHVEHPLIWSKNAAPNRQNWWSNQWEFIVAIMPPDCKHVWNWEAIATPQKFANGGVFRQRGVNGKRRYGKTTERNELARPYDIIRATVGGGHMGHPLAHENDAPFPESLITPIVLALTNPDDIVTDTFSGSGTTVAAAVKNGRRGLGIDIRENQKELGERRLAEVVKELQAGRGANGSIVQQANGGNS